MTVKRDLMAMLAGARRVKAAEGHGLELRLLTAMEVLQARREATELVREDRERAICSNACLLARALERKKKPVFQSGQEVLNTLTPEQIASLARQWAALDRRENPSPEDDEGRVQALKKAWSTRLRRAFAGVCSVLSARCLRRNGSGR